MYTAIEVANYFFKQSVKEGLFITPMKVIKLCYIAQGFYLSCKNKSLFPEEIQAWKYGAMIPVLFYEFEGVGDGLLKHPAGAPLGLNEHENFIYPCVDNKEKEIIEGLEAVWEKFKFWSAAELSGWTGRKGSAWSIAKRIGYNAPIRPDLLKKEYDDL